MAEPEDKPRGGSNDSMARWEAAAVRHEKPIWAVVLVVLTLAYVATRFGGLPMWLWAWPWAVGLTFMALWVRGKGLRILWIPLLVLAVWNYSDAWRYMAGR